MVRFIHITDTHLGGSEEALVCGVKPAEYARQLAKELGSLKFKIDFAVHTGDVANAREDNAYLLAKDIFKSLKIPLHVVAGNHDTGALMWRFFPQPDLKKEISKSGTYTYSFKVSRQNFVVLDGSRAEELPPHGELCHEDMIFLEEQLRKEDAPTSIFVHFPSLDFDCPWVDKTMLISNGQVLHRLLVNHRHKVAGVFHGHIHRGATLVCDGILYSSAPSAFCQFTTWPDTEKPEDDHNIALRYNLVTVEGTKVLVKEQAADIRTLR